MGRGRCQSQGKPAQEEGQGRRKRGPEPGGPRALDEALAFLSLRLFGHCSGKPGGAGRAVACSVALQPSCPTRTSRGSGRPSTWVNTRSLGLRGSGGPGRQRPLQSAARRREASGPPAICSALVRRRWAGTAVPWRRHLQTSRSPWRPELLTLVPRAVRAERSAKLGKPGSFRSRAFACCVTPPTHTHTPRSPAKLPFLHKPL